MLGRDRSAADQKTVVGSTSKTPAALSWGCGRHSVLVLLANRIDDRRQLGHLHRAPDPDEILAVGPDRVQIIAVGQDVKGLAALGVQPDRLVVLLKGLHLDVMGIVVALDRDHDAAAIPFVGVGAGDVVDGVVGIFVGGLDLRLGGDEALRDPRRDKLRGMPSCDTASSKEALASISLGAAVEKSKRKVSSLHRPSAPNTSTPAA